MQCVFDMKKILYWFLLFVFLMSCYSCATSRNHKNTEQQDGSLYEKPEVKLIVETRPSSSFLNKIRRKGEFVEDANEHFMGYLNVPGKKTYHIYNASDSVQIYKHDVDKANCMFVVSKKDFRLYVYENKELVAHFPICYGRNPETKTQDGDFATPNCDEQHPFRISQIVDSHSWRHNFNDGRGNIPSCGPWFLRLKLNGALSSNTTIGIHGCTSNEESVPGRDSEGCVRLRDADIITLKSKYARIGTKVIIRGKDVDKYDWEKEAEAKLGEKYVKQMVEY